MSISPPPGGASVGGISDVPGLESALNEKVSHDELDEAIQDLDFPAPVIEQFVTNIAVHETFVTELTEQATFIEQTVNQITQVEEDNTYITQITENNTFVTNVTQQINANVNGKKGVANELATLAADGQLTHAQVPSELLTFGIPFVIDGGGQVIATGVKGDFEIPFAHTIVAWRLLADVSGSIVIDLWRDSYANYPPVVGDSISTSKPTLSSATKAEDTTVTDWSETGAAGDIYRVNVDSASTVTRVTLSLTVVRVL